MFMTLFVALLVSVVALGVGIAVSRRRGPVVRVLVGVGVLFTGALAFFALLALALPM